MSTELARLVSSMGSLISRRDCSSAREQIDPFLDVVLYLHPRAGEHAQAVEVADQRPVRVLDPGGSPAMSSAYWSSAA